MSLIHTLYQARVLTNTIIHSWLNVLSRTRLSVPVKVSVCTGRKAAQSSSAAGFLRAAQPSFFLLARWRPHPLPRGLEGPLVLRGLEQPAVCTLTHPGWAHAPRGQAHINRVYLATLGRLPSRGRGAALSSGHCSSRLMAQCYPNIFQLVPVRAFWLFWVSQKLPQVP